MKYIVLDLESRGELDLTDVGLDLYSRHPATEIMMVGYRVQGGEKKLWELANFNNIADMPEDLQAALDEPEYIIIAWNAEFERIMFKRKLGIDIPITRWRDPMVQAYSLSMPGALDKVGEILQLPVEDRKDPEGERLMKFFSMPAKKRKATKKFNMFGVDSVFHERDFYPAKWEKFKSYCMQDVHSEEILWLKMLASPLPESIWEEWFLDQEMNEIGIPCNREMAEAALWLAQEDKRRMVDGHPETGQIGLKQLTGLENPLSDAQIKEWLEPRGYELGSVKADYVKAEMANPYTKMTEEAKTVMKIRLEAKKNSASKLIALLEMLGPNNRLCFQFRFMGAARTGRWSGRGIQPQNLPRPIKAVKKDFQRIIDLIMLRDYDTIKKEYGSVMAAVVSSIRMVFQAPPGKKMDIADLNAIENRGLGYLARCPAILKVFKENKDPYLAFGVYLFKRPYEDLKAEYDLYEATKGKEGSDQPRQQSKAPVLGGGYGLGGGESYINEFGDEVRGGMWGYALNVCGVDMPKALAHEAVSILRAAWPEVVQYWKDLEEGFKRVFYEGGECYIGRESFRKNGDVWEWQWNADCPDGAVLVIDRMPMKSGGYMIRIKLPSGRRLHYLNVSIEREPFKYRDKKTGKMRTATGEVIYYDGIEHSATSAADGSRAKKSYKWGRVKTYGGKLCENVVQAFCRDLLAWGMRKAIKAGFQIIGCFHDELAALSDKDDFFLNIDYLVECMSESPPWAPDMPLGAAGFSSQFYRKG